MRKSREWRYSEGNYGLSFTFMSDEFSVAEWEEIISCLNSLVLTFNTFVYGIPIDSNGHTDPVNMFAVCDVMESPLVVNEEKFGQRFMWKGWIGWIINQNMTINWLQLSVGYIGFLYLTERENRCCHYTTTLWAAFTFELALKWQFHWFKRSQDLPLSKVQKNSLSQE